MAPGRLLTVGCQVDDDAAQEKQGSDGSGEQDLTKGGSQVRLRRGEEGCGVEVQGGEWCGEPCEPVGFRLRLADEDGCGCGHADDKGEDLRGGDGSSDLAKCGVAAEELRLPPQEAGMRNGCGLDCLGACALKGVGEEYLLPALGTCVDVGAEFGIAGVGPVSLQEH